MTAVGSDDGVVRSDRARRHRGRQAAAVVYDRAAIGRNGPADRAPVDPTVADDQETFAGTHRYARKAVDQLSRRGKQGDAACADDVVADAHDEAVANRGPGRERDRDSARGAGEDLAAVLGSHGIVRALEDAGQRHFKLPAVIDNAVAGGEANRSCAGRRLCCTGSRL
jgi:hypothetical protein